MADDRSTALLRRLLLEGITALGLDPRVAHGAGPDDATRDAVNDATRDATRDAATDAPREEALAPWLEELARAYGRPELGFEAATAIAIGAPRSPVVYVMMSSPTLGDALAALARFAPVAVERPTRARVRAREDDGALAFEFGVAASGRQYDRFTATLLVRICRFLLGDERFVPARVEFAHAHAETGAPALAAAIATFFGEAARHGAARNALVFTPEQAARTPVHASPSLHEAHERAIATELARVPAAPLDITTRVREALAKRLGEGPPTMRAIARDLGLSTRTLQRRLDDAGTQFQHEIAEIRKDLARALLARDDRSVDAVAQATGYRSAASFHRAFRQWEGTTPAAFRARVRAS